MNKKHPIRSLLINLVLAAVAFSLLAWVVHSQRDDLRGVFRRGFDWRYFVAGFLVYLTGLVITFVRWYWLVRVVEPAFRLRDALLLGFIGNVWNLVVPGAVGGDLVKAAFLARMNIKRTQAIASMVIDRIVGLLGLFVLAGMAGIFAWPRAPRDVRGLIVLVWIAIAAGLLVLAAIFTQSLTTRYPQLLEGHGKVALVLRELRALSVTYRKRLGLVAGMLLLSSCCHAMSVLAFYIVSLTLFSNALPTLAEHFLMVPLTLFTTAVPLPFGAIGLSENVGQQLFKLVNHPEGAVGVLAFRVLMYAGALVGACVYLANVHTVRALTESAEHIKEELLEGELEEPEAAEEPIA
jgi:uncharacterized protein (TIRG00374 family)